MCRKISRNAVVFRLRFVIDNSNKNFGLVKVTFSVKVK